MAAKTTRMIRTILLIAASCLAWLGAGAQQYEGAHLKFESSFHNFGSVPRWGGDLVWEFEYTNDGSAPLVIVRAQTTCSCTFSKVIQIYSNSVSGRELITVCGNSLDTE